MKDEKGGMIIDNEIFAEYINRYQRLVITICLSFTKNYFDAEELAQQTFVTAYEKFHKFDGNNFKAWITTIAANKCRDYLKSAARNNLSLSAEEYQCIEDSNNLPEEIFMEKVSSDRVYSLCLKLKEPYRAVAVNYFCNNIKLSQIAEDTGQSLKTLQTQLYRSKKLLKVLWEEEYING